MWRNQECGGPRNNTQPSKRGGGRALGGGGEGGGQGVKGGTAETPAPLTYCPVRWSGVSNGIV
jgi:hypothetical protein